MTTATATADAAPAPTAIRPLYVTSAGVVSSAGHGLAALAGLLRRGAGPAEGPSGEGAAAYPPRPVRAVEGFDVKAHLGRKGTKYLDRLTSFGLVACKEAIEGMAAAEVAGDRTGVVLATNTGSVSSHSALLYDTLTLDKPYLVNPGQFPNTVMNCAAGQVAIRNGLRGLNATVAGGQSASLLAFRHARLALTLDRADRLLVGGAEELSAPAAWAWHRTGVLKDEAALGEGCAVFTVQQGAPADDSDVLAELLACEVRFTPDARDYADGLAHVVTRALDRSGVRPEEVAVVSLGAAHHRGLERIEERGVRTALGGGGLPRTVRVADVLGETYSASGAMQLAALLALWQAEPPAARTAALVTSVGRDGNAAAMVVRSPLR
ncbi:beta-ketoacyl synthase N-terminal-like domain-containing protein [Streptomyces albidochromogenes]|uniref:Beta-ketoacyl synthase N-terminal-like domain-containing protein n=1 Tax=Streptomyces albidochromogenes TaxID=329524 RepID=A0ABW6FYG3_9ACTN